MHQRARAAITLPHCNERRWAVVQVPSAHAVVGTVCPPEAHSQQRPCANQGIMEGETPGVRKRPRPSLRARRLPRARLQQRPSAAARPPMPRAPPAAPMTRTFSPIGSPLRPQGASICYSNADTIRSVPWYGVKSCFSPTPLRRLAAAAGVHVETIRYYQRRRLIAEPPRPVGGVRRYSEAECRTAAISLNEPGDGIHPCRDFEPLATEDSPIRAERRGELAATKLQICGQPHSGAAPIA